VRNGPHGTTIIKKLPGTRPGKKGSKAMLDVTDRESVSKPEGDLLDLSEKPTTRCEQCGNDFTPRNGSGGRRQRFCSEKCKTAFHNSQRVNVSTPHLGESAPTAKKQTRIHGPLAAGNVLDGTLPPEDFPANYPFDPPAPSKIDRPSDFDWLKIESVLHEQRQTAIYWNADGDLVIRQRADWDEENDPFICICENNVGAFIDKLTDFIGIPSVGKRS
jgi:hypothetical protein